METINTLAKILHEGYTYYFSITAGPRKTHHKDRGSERSIGNVQQYIIINISIDHEAANEKNIR